MWWPSIHTQRVEGSTRDWPSSQSHPLCKLRPLLAFSFSTCVQHGTWKWAVSSGRRRRVSKAEGDGNGRWVPPDRVTQRSRRRETHCRPVDPRSRCRREVHFLDRSRPPLTVPFLSPLGRHHRRPSVRKHEKQKKRQREGRKDGRKEGRKKSSQVEENKFPCVSKVLNKSRYISSFYLIDCSSFVI